MNALGYLFLGVMLVCAGVAFAISKYTLRNWTAGRLTHIVGGGCLFASFIALVGWMLNYDIPLNPNHGGPMWPPVPWYTFAPWALMAVLAYAIDYLAYVVVGRVERWFAD